ncbi:MAG: hypothetical protein AAFS10_04215 [Myxococcota bacterium]
MRRRWSVAAVGGLLALVVGCGDEDSIEQEGPVDGSEGSAMQTDDALPMEGNVVEIPEDGVWVDAARYVLTWSWGSAWPDEDGQGWWVENDLGYTVHIEQGYMVNYSMSLTPCALSATIHRPPPTPWAVALLDALMGVSVAHAGHGDEADPSTSAASRVENLASPGTVVLDERTFPGDLYCRVHYLVARSDTGTEQLPDDVPMEGLSLHVRGSWQRPGEHTPTPFVVDASVAHGLLPRMAEVFVGADEGSSSVVVTVERKLEELWTGVDLASLDEAELARALLTNLMDSATVTVAAADDE